MSKISLRAYNKEIEALINRGANDEAIVNCRHILRSYPKCIATYRNLAKALLESKKYHEAEDIFDRVLSVFPDDFVSHIGISIIKENEGNLDAAIWHMELAYDIQPSNPALTSELRRLFGRRDGVQPAKIRMTRGALIRMYARGELFQQAIAEIQSALAADPKRVDLIVVLADMYYYSGAITEAAETCSDLLSNLPYCFEANQLMMQIAPKMSQADSARMYRSRLAELDPYYALITTPDTLSDEISEDQILLEHYAGEGSSYEENQGLPKTTAADWQKITESEELDWAKDEPREQESAVSSVTTDGSLDDLLEASITRSLKADDHGVDTEATSDPSAANIPDWMRSAGWIPATHSEQELLDNSVTSPENISNEKNEIQPGVLPEWLQNVKPDTGEQGAVEEEPLPDPESTLPKEPIAVKGVPPELESLQPDAQAQDSASALINRSQEPQAENTNPEQGETGDKMPTDSSTNNENEWLNQFRNDSPDKGEENDLPDWLKDFESEKDQPTEENMDIPEWLKSLEPLESPDEATPAVVSSSSFKDDVFPKEDDGDSVVAGKSFLFTKDLTNEEIQAGKYDTAYIAPESQSSPSEWEAPAEKHPESETESAVASITEASPTEAQSAVESTDFMFTKPLTEDEVRSGKLDSTYLPPEAHSLPSDWESSLEKTPEPAPEPAKEVLPVASSLPAWVKKVLKPSTPAEVPAQHSTPAGAASAVSTTLPPLTDAAPSGPAKSSILDQLSKAAAPVESAEPVMPAAEAAFTTPPQTGEPEVAPVSERFEAQSSPTADEMGEEPIEDLASGPQGPGAISDETNNELLEWLRGFKGTEEQPKEATASADIPAPEPETEAENALDRLDTFAQAESQPAVSEVTPVTAGDGIENFVESLQNTVILQDETEPTTEAPELAQAESESTPPEEVEVSGISASVEEPEAVDESEEVFEPVDEAKLSEFFVQPVVSETVPTTPAEPEAEVEPEVSEAKEPVSAEASIEEPVPQIVVPAVEEAQPAAAESEIPQVIPEPVEAPVSEVPPKIVVPEPIEEVVVHEPVSEIEQPVQETRESALPKTSPIVPDPLLVAESALDKGDMPLALNEFNMALHDEAKLSSTIVALKSAVEKHTDDNDLWQLLGDALAHSNRFDEAFSAYDKAESLLLNLTK